MTVTTPLHKGGGPAKSEWLKSKAKTTAFSLSSPEKDHQEAEVRSQDTPSQSLEKLDMSRESSGASTRSDQTTLEYQDAPSPGDLEGIFVALRPEGSSTELIINLTEPTEEDSDKDVLELEATPPHLEKQTGKNSLPNGHKVCDRTLSTVRKASGLKNCTVPVRCPCLP